MKKKNIKKIINLEYYEDCSVPEEGSYKGGPITPDNFDKLLIHTYDEGDHFQVHFKGSRKSFEELGKYLINLANYNTLDPDYHDHFDSFDNIEGNTELIIHHSDSDWNN